ncbi:hypothetical protein Cgig2_029288 [Carnegiea gigantea]|uniref:Reverse transcriptase zinc-binding domain-containing protein n=1 Tax=Carnegiea gigantea TaxID=171969 RepID=A0A9Q1QQF7_9CARY|nr:hypothetical protein Cgig2_029288 [Carnegiea gigantea]
MRRAKNMISGLKDANGDRCTREDDIANDNGLLVAWLLRAKYYPDGDLFAATLGPRPSFTWRCLMGARQVVLRGSCWLVGNGQRPNIWDDRWLPRPHSFKPITLKTELWAHLKFGDLIDRGSTSWHADLVHQIFLPYDVDLSLSIPLRDFWPNDKLVWLYHSQGHFTVRTAYHVLHLEALTNTGSSSTRDNSLWRAIWRCKIPPRIKLFGWRAASGVLPSAIAIARRMPNFSMQYSICGYPEESKTHDVLSCPLATQNRFIFGTPDRNLSMLGKRAIDFVSSFCLAQLNETPP